MFCMGCGKLMVKDDLGLEDYAHMQGYRCNDYDEADDDNVEPGESKGCGFSCYIPTLVIDEIDATYPWLVVISWPNHMTTVGLIVAS